MKSWLHISPWGWPPSVVETEAIIARAAEARAEEEAIVRAAGA